jgi:hydantoinase/carbamoylase family amidase
MDRIAIDRDRSTARIERDIETLAGPGYTTSSEAIRRYAYTRVYRNTLDYFTRELEAIGFDVTEDPVGTLVARNRPRGEAVFGIGSHCDSNRNGGKYDGTMGVVTALEVCRLDHELGLGLPLQLVSFLEEEGSGFGQMLLGSRIIAQRVSEDDLRERFRAIDDGRSFWEHAEDAGYEPARWRECAHVLDDLTGWIEMHIEQARVLQDTGNRIGIVTAIAGYVHGDITVTGRADHAGGTPMGGRLDAGTVAAECILELERLATAAGKGTVGTVGEIRFEPSLINVVPAQARFSLDIRGTDEDAYRGVARDIAAFAEQAAGRRGMTAAFSQRQTAPPTPSDTRIVDALDAAARASEEPYMRMPSGAAHDTMCVADRVPTAMVFVPNLDGISHSPDELAYPADGALAAEIILNAIAVLEGKDAPD